MKVDVIKNVIPIMIECLKYGLFWKKNKNKKIISIPTMWFYSYQSYGIFKNAFDT